MALYSTFKQIWQNQKSGGYTVKRFTIHACDAFNLAWDIAGLISSFDGGCKKVRRERAVAMEEEMLNGSFTMFGLPLVVIPPFSELVTNTLSNNKDNLLDMLRESNPLFKQLTVQ